jgi:TolB-like protein/DNA-binding winged helix-turn-helix (wHTH) protein/Tfp pilus assembly protein PilF
MPPASRPVLRFLNCTLDPGGYELRRDGRRVRIERQPMDLLLLLVERRGQLVTRAEIAERLWGDGVFVEVETGIHTAIRKIRLALRDAADAPRFVETVPGRGYRFIAPVEVVLPATAPPAPPAAAPSAPAPPARVTPATGDPSQPPSEAARPAAGAAPQPATAWWPWLAAAGLVLGALVSLLWSPRDAAAVRIAVLPFATLGEAAELAPIADGLAEETIATLGQSDPEHLAVVGRTSMLAYRGTTKSLTEIGRELQATHLVESSLRTDGTRVRLTTRLVRAADQVQLWSQSFDREPSRMLDMQQELSRAVVEQIRLRVTPARATALARRHTQDPAAYDAYLRGLSFASRRTPEANRQAVELFTQATTLDSGYALAWAALAMVQAASLLNGDGQPGVVGPRVRDAAERAVAAAPQLAEAQFVHAYLHWGLEWDWPAAERGMRQARALDPQNVDPLRVLGHVLSQMGRHDEAAALMAQARALEPLDALTHALSSQVAFQARRQEEARQHAVRAVALAPSLWIGHMMLAQASAAMGQVGAALEAVDEAERLSGRNSKAVSLRAHVLATSGRTAEARQVVDALEAASRTRYVPPVALALVRVGLGEVEAAFAGLERAVEARDVHLIYLTVDPKWDPLRDDPRFAALLRRCGFVR